MPAYYYAFSPITLLYIVLTMHLHTHKWPPCNFLFGYVFKEFCVVTVPNTTKYVILRSLSIFGLTAAKLWLIQI